MRLMDSATGVRVFVPEVVVPENREGLEPASADDSFYVIGQFDRYELKGFLIPVGELEERGIPRRVAREVSMIVSLRTSEHVILLSHGEGLWELLIQAGKGLPDTYTFKVNP